MSNAPRRTAKTRVLSAASGLALPAMFATFALWANDAAACAVCFGDPNSALTKGAANGVIFLAVVVYLVLMSMGMVGVFWILRARKRALALASIEGGSPPADPINGAEL